MPGSTHRTGRWLAQDSFATAGSGASAAAGTWPACMEGEQAVFGWRLLLVVVIVIKVVVVVVVKVGVGGAGGAGAGVVAKPCTCVPAHLWRHLGNRVTLALFATAHQQCCVLVIRGCVVVSPF